MNTSKKIFFKPNALVLCGYGINCEEETAYCLNRAGANTKVVHVNTLIKNKKLLENSQIFVIPGGFSYGDHIASGRILANKLRHNLYEQLLTFINSGKAVLGICNGFQVLVKSGLLEESKVDTFSKTNNINTQIQKNYSISIIANSSQNYEDRWVNLLVEKTNNLWLKGIRFIKLPVRHGEGRVVFANKNAETFYEKNSLNALRYANKVGKAAKAYPQNPNGSQLSVAGISSINGNVLGLMPHPEAFAIKMNAPGYFSMIKVPNENNSAGLVKAIPTTQLQIDSNDTQLQELLHGEDGAGMAIFYNAVRAMKQI